MNTESAQVPCNEEMAIRLYEMLHKKDIRRQTTLHWPIANKLGINEALLLEIIHNWSEYNAYKGAVSYFYHGEWWTSDTYDNWFKNYPSFGSVRTIQRIFKQLEDQGYIISCRPFGKNKNGTKYYRPNKAKIGILLMEDSPFCHIQDPQERQNGKSDMTEWQVGHDKMASSSIYKDHKDQDQTQIEDLGVYKREEEQKNIQRRLSIQFTQDSVHPIHSMEQKLSIHQNDYTIREEATKIWNAEKPGNFIAIKDEIDHHSWSYFKNNYIIPYGVDQALEDLKYSLIYAREREDSFWRDRDKAFIFADWVNKNKSEKIRNLSLKHRHYMENDFEYSRRVSNPMFTKDLGSYVTGISLDDRDQANAALDIAKSIQNEQLKEQADILRSEEAKRYRESQEKLNQTRGVA